jgi:hypothetical protein|uniref:Uncharacterized protein n=1 Tax=viral metagenome TaxID=1070528 RepID=A0A6C0DXE4_9ZZZZ
MATDAFYNFSNKVDNENDSIKLNIDELYTKKQQQDLNILNNYNKILLRIHNKIKYVSKNLVNENCCWYVMPEVIIGIPMYDYRDCTAYVIEKLRENKFVVRYTHPNLLFISWKHWVPSYVRNEIKKKTGTLVDEFGNIITNNTQEIKNENESNSNELLFSSTKQIKNTNNTINNYKDTKSYKPSGNLVYNNNLLERLKV